MNGMIVTVPKPDIDYCMKEKFAFGDEDPCIEAWWYISGTPRQLDDNKKFYIGFVFDGGIRVVVSAWLDYENTPTWRPVDCCEIEIIPMKGFQGFRYYDFENIKIVTRSPHSRMCICGRCGDHHTSGKQ